MRSWLVVLLVGCWTSTKPEPARPASEPAPPPGAVRAARPPQTEADRALLVLGGFRDQMCGCRDKSCADHVQEDLNRWAQDQARQATADKAARLEDDQLQQMTDITE